MFIYLLFEYGLFIILCIVTLMIIAKIFLCDADRCGQHHWCNGLTWTPWGQMMLVQCTISSNKRL